ncbi:THUMP domain-containing protein [Marine Group I thaumarchaeote SCGC AAA799-E16]|uniref:THUMP domain-containing protein n=4 Tax=Marine Group I TaxID=905826 RepID=A0A081RNK4_9ARCH|nr:THUMP domain-containing protein [Marine Group I thaumarchaeote SCGC AAA799-N04]KER06289.1 THUMP domain-containing protein [Marine Group I thaumarchaeote SCGC AAA799-E16]KFM15485.1 THUMP domain-containing protein [Marine Group I thaumarchaeote SCGC AAA799-D11]KFM16727.1 THUMP domain-containing protein [Marine Group I thaumarchaeote SCGC RSA3]
MNLIITCARHLEPETEEELRGFLDEFGDSDPKVTITSMSGILTAETKLDPVEVVRKIKEMLLDEPWSVRYCLRIIPIQRTVETKIEEIEKIVEELSDNISKDEKYRISIEKRNSDMSSQDIITKIAKKIKNQVSLEFPDKVVLIEILGNKTGISVLKKSDILSTEKTKRSISE